MFFSKSQYHPKIGSKDLCVYNSYAQSRAVAEQTRGDGGLNEETFRSPLTFSFYFLIIQINSPH
jgi:hypothetical protein